MRYRFTRLRTGVSLGWLLAGALLTACGGSSGTATPDGKTPIVCPVSEPTPCPNPPLHYADVQPIIAQRCGSCHSGNTPQWPLTTYQDVADWNDTVRDEVHSCAMPPPEANVPITQAERDTIVTWSRCGYLK